MAEHKSDCAVNNAPALPVGPCDCGADQTADIDTARLVERLQEVADQEGTGELPHDIFALVENAADTIDALKAEIDVREIERSEGQEVMGEMAARIAALEAMSAEMAEDGGLWFVAETAAEAYLQHKLRKLCAAIEQRSPEECATRALEAK